MKANEAPEKIYFEVNNNLIGLYDSAILGMFSVKKNKTAIEYIRKDAFIEKVLKYLDVCFYFNNSRYRIECGVFDSKEEMLEYFKKYMED